MLARRFVMAANAQSRPIQASMQAKLEAQLKPAALRIINESHKHAGHSGNPTGAADAETHFRYFVAVVRKSRKGAALLLLTVCVCCHLAATTGWKSCPPNLRASASCNAIRYVWCIWLSLGVWIAAVFPSICLPRRLRCSAPHNHTSTGACLTQPHTHTHTNRYTCRCPSLCMHALSSSADVSTAG